MVVAKFNGSSVTTSRASTQIVAWRILRHFMRPSVEGRTCAVARSMLLFN